MGEKEVPTRLQPERFYSALGYEPSTLTKLHSSSNSAMALASFGSLTWPSQSMKKKYSHAFRLLGRDSIFVMLMRKRRKAARARCNAPTLSTRLIIRLV